MVVGSLWDFTARYIVLQMSLSLTGKLLMKLNVSIHEIAKSKWPSPWALRSSLPLMTTLVGSGLKLMSQAGIGKWCRSPILSRGPAENEKVRATSTIRPSLHCHLTVICISLSQFQGALRGCILPWQKQGCLNLCFGPYLHNKPLNLQRECPWHAWEV